jgi:hypothetical protein
MGLNQATVCVIFVIRNDTMYNNSVLMNRRGCLSSSIHHHSLVTRSSTLYSLVTEKAS